VAGRLVAKDWVKAPKKKAGQHARLGKFRRVDWTRPHCTQVGSWLWNCLSQMDCFDEDECGYPCFHADHKADLDKLAEEVLFDHPLYKPRLVEPPAWTAWRVECPGGIGVTFVKASDSEDGEAGKDAIGEAAPVRHSPRQRQRRHNFWTEPQGF